MFSPGAMLTTSGYVPVPPRFPITTFVISVASGSTSDNPVVVPGSAKHDTGA